MNSIEKILASMGPARTGRLVEALTRSSHISPEAARQRLSRARTPVERYPGHLLPKREAFFYLRDQRNTEKYWNNLLRDLRETRSVYACAIDAFSARGGIIPVNEFSVISGAPIALKKQVPADLVANKLLDLGVMDEMEIGMLGPCYGAKAYSAVESLGFNHSRARRLAENIILDGLRQWIRNNGIGSYNKIAIRGEPDQPLMVGQFKWDLTGPSYLLSTRRAKTPANGFVVADVFSEGRLDVHHIRYFIRKVGIYQKTSNSGKLFPILMAESYTGKALNEGHAAGLMLTTPQSLFGRNVAASLSDLIHTLSNAASIAAIDGERLCKFMDDLSEIEGRTGNMRGVLFELIAAHIAKYEFGGNIDIGVIHTHQENGQKTDLDVVCVVAKKAVNIIECKGKIPGGTVSLEEIEEWLKKIPIMRDYVASSNHLREYQQTYEFWTTGSFQGSALAKLREERAMRTIRPIKWKDGRAVRRMVADLKLKAIGDTLDQHFVKHPLA